MIVKKPDVVTGMFGRTRRLVMKIRSVVAMIVSSPLMGGAQNGLP
jgi:hypothetical protein|tara:strand:- start:374 stop:508 length:135 start_codon:yes stop_codon:yes gene_type:complete